MANNKGFTIEVSCSDKEWWRYNVAFTCGCFNGEGVRIGFAAADSHVADVGSKPEPPKGTPPPRKATLETMPCDNILVYLYIIPHTLPEENDIDATRPFDALIKVYYGGKLLKTRHQSVNRWSGISLAMKFDHDEE